MPKAKTPAKKAPAKRAPAAAPADQHLPRRPKYLPHGMIWCAKCLALASAEGSETTPHGFAFCRAHKEAKK